MNVLLHGWSNTTNAVVVLIVVSPVIPLAQAGVMWLFVLWLLRKYGKQTLSTSARAQQALPAESAGD